MGATNASEHGVTIKEDDIATSVKETTPLANPDVIKTALRLRARWSQRSPSDALAVYIMDEELPILIRRGKTIFGRTADRKQGAALDLSKYNARALGVSRKHALVNYSETGWTVEDLGSTNGTCVNATKLKAHQPHSLRNGDMVRLGQFTMFIYFQ